MKFSRNWGDISKRLADEATNNGSSSNDKRMYKPKFSNDGTFEALIRFLPAPGDEIPFIKKFAHRFKDRGGEYNEECLTTIGENCPVCEANREIWNTDPGTARQRSRGNSAIANIIVLSDPQVPDNVGKVFLYRFGKKLLEKVTGKCFPDEKKRATGAKPINIFDYLV